MHEESVRRALERREMLSGIDNSSKFKKGKGIQGESLARMKRKRAERRRDARKEKQAQHVASRASNLGSAVRATSSRGEKKVGKTAMKSAQAQEDKDASLARFLRKGKNVFKPEVESAHARDTRLALEDENFHLSAEMRRLDARKAERWRELVRTNQWATHEEDAVIIALDEEIEQTRLRQVKVYTLLKENKESSTKRLLEQLEMTAGTEAAEKLKEQKRQLERSSENSLNLQSSSVDWEEP